MEPLVSVIIPVYNVLPYLREALDSVINQTYKNLEILIVDDGSTDGSGEVCNEYLSDPRVIVIHQENKGLSGARNTGLDRMTGEYVAFLDSDDAFMPEMIEKMVEAIIRTQADMAICGYASCNTNLRLDSNIIQKTPSLVIYSEQLLSTKAALNMLARGNTGWTVWNKLYKHSVWDDISFPEGSNYEDLQIICHIFERCNRSVLVPGLYVLYRHRSNSISSCVTEKNMLDYIHAVKTVEKYAEEHSPSLFSAKIMPILWEQFAYSLSIRYAYSLYHTCSKCIRTQIRNEALLRWNLIANYSKLRSKLIYILFIFTPHLIAPTRACWQFGRRIWKKALHP